MRIRLRVETRLRKLTTHSIHLIYKWYMSGERYNDRHVQCGRYIFPPAYSTYTLSVRNALAFRAGRACL